MNRTRAHRYLLLAVLCLAPACTGPSRLRPDRVPAALEEARARRASGDLAGALRLLQPASASIGLDTALKNEVQTELESTAQLRVQELSEGGNPEALVDLAKLDLPRQIAVTAGIDGARQLYESGKRRRALDVVKDIDRRFPVHHERSAAGALVADLGFSMAERPPKTLGIWKDVGSALEALDYLVLTYPTEPRCDRAYAEMAELQEGEGAYQLAIEHYESLLLYHPFSPLVPYAEARIPALRLASLDSPDYDRQSLRDARRELETWLDRHEGGPLEDEVVENLSDCIRRLSEAELGNARFYRRVNEASGTRLHAEKALELAQLVDDTERERKALDMLAALEERLQVQGEPEGIPDGPTATAPPPRAEAEHIEDTP